MEAEEKNKQKCRLPYKKPALRVVELEAREVLATGCKTPSGSAFDFVTSCMGNGCAQAGS